MGKWSKRPGRKPRVIQQLDLDDEDESSIHHRLADDPADKYPGTRNYIPPFKVLILIGLALGTPAVLLNIFPSSNRSNSAG